MLISIRMKYYVYNISRKIIIKSYYKFRIYNILHVIII